MSVSKECLEYIKKINKMDKKSHAKKLSGYNVFCMQNRENIDGTPTEKMTKLGESWKSLADEEKAVFKTKSEELNTVAEREFEVEEEDQQLKELKEQISEVIASFKKLKAKEAKKAKKEQTTVAE